MRVGVLSDTHMSGPDERFLSALRSVFKGVAKILHCGDYVSHTVLEALQEEGWDLIGVAGNMDGPQIQQALPVSRTIALGRKKIGLIHGWGPPQGLENRVVEAFEGVDVVVFGHSHRHYWGRVGGAWVFNPGAACGWGSPAGPTVGILNIGGEVRGDIHPLRTERR